MEDIYKIVQVKDKLIKEYQKKIELLELIILTQQIEKQQEKDKVADNQLSLTL